MKRLSKKLTDYIVETGIVSKESYAVYFYGFQIGLEMLCCFMVCLCISAYLHMIPEFFVFTAIFGVLRTYAGGVHLNSFASCFLCSVFVQTLILFIDSKYEISLVISWCVILVCTFLILKSTPVESIKHMLDIDEKKHCKKMAMKMMSGIYVFTICCTVIGRNAFVSLVAMIVLVVLISQYIGIIKYKIEKNKYNGKT